MPTPAHHPIKTYTLVLVCAVVVTLTAVMAVSASAITYGTITNDPNSNVTLDFVYPDGLVNHFSPGDGPVMYELPMEFYLAPSTYLVEFRRDSYYTEFTGFSSACSVQFHVNGSNAYIVHVGQGVDELGYAFRVNDSHITGVLLLDIGTFSGGGEAIDGVYNQGYNAGYSQAEADYADAINGNATIDASVVTDTVKAGFNGLGSIFASFLNIRIAGIPLFALVASVAGVGLVIFLLKLFL